MTFADKFDDGGHFGLAMQLQDDIGMWLAECSFEQLRLIGEFIWSSFDDMKHLSLASTLDLISEHDMIVEELNEQEEA